MKLYETWKNLPMLTLDDLVIFSDTWEEHLVYLEAILGKLQEFGLTSNMTKCQWAMAECMYLGGGWWPS